MRRLIWVPMMHANEETLPEFEDKSINETSEKWWKAIRSDIKKLKLNPTSLKIFADGLTEDTIGYLFRPGPTSELMRDLAGRGAILIPTEDEALTVTAEELLVRISAQFGLTNDASYRTDEENYRNVDNLISLLSEQEKNLKSRDMYAATRINENLNEEDIGVLFIGGAHRVQDYLDEDITFEPVGEKTLEFARNEELDISVETLIEEVRNLRDSYLAQSSGQERR